MPATTLPPVPHYESASVTQEDIDWADFPIIDISKSSTPEGRAELANIVRDAMRTYGFIYVVNHGLTQAQNDRMVDIADIPFSQVSEDDKRQYASKIKETGSYRGFKPRQFWTIDNGVKDQIEHYNMHHSIVEQQHPKELQPFFPEIRAFAEHCHYKVLHPILRLLALGLELPEEAFIDMFDFDVQGETYMLFMKYFPRSEEDEVKSKNVWMKGHADIGAVSILWSQPVTALQILSPDGKWRYVNHIPNGIIVNIGDTMEMLSGGFYKATIHRVVQPPPDQRGCTRLGLFYFGYPNDDIKLVPMKNSPALQRVGIVRKCADEDAPTMEEMRKARTRTYGTVPLKKTEDGHEEEVSGGVVVKHYN
ncbi:Clavaminate synthase-like protein [Dichomitus squalens]|uniref:Clavaminate synthase-like protein n=1 Tax=Dichomitus squalens TaxID=114155 RepID=A0A4Q9PT02_9APHY|nr:Clavaminate synthase-like protein [Dichomitus squalens]